MYFLWFSLLFYFPAHTFVFCANNSLDGSTLFVLQLYSDLSESWVNKAEAPATTLEQRTIVSQPINTCWSKVVVPDSSPS